MKKKILLAIILLLSVPLYAVENSSVTSYNLNLDAEIIETYDPGYMKVKLNNGEVIESKYCNIPFDIVFEWEYNEKSFPRKVIFSYNFKDGITIQDIKTNKIFNLCGSIQNHPIEMAEKKCISKSPTTMRMIECKDTTYRAWDAELNRAYSRLGGSKNKQLKSTQLAWIKFKKEARKLINEEYSKKEGSMWGPISIDKWISITKGQTIFLQSLYNDR